MTNQLFDLGEEFVLDNSVDGASVDVSLHNDSTDTLADGADVGDITTEPDTSGAYARQTVTLSTAQNANNNYEAQVPDVTFDTSDVDQAVDSGFVVVSFQSSIAGDSSTTDHLFFSFAIEDSNGTQTELNLTNFNDLTLSGQSLSLD
jgi:hypothetical protein